MGGVRVLGRDIIDERAVMDIILYTRSTYDTGVIEELRNALEDLLLSAIFP